jgi:hypothetical protein
VSTEEQCLVLFEPNELLKLKSINLTFPESSEKVQITSINCELGKHAFVGYSNGIAKMIHLKSSKEEG